jgi:hypothetical protein
VSGPVKTSAWISIWSAVFPGNLKKTLILLHEEAITLMREVRASRNEMHLNPDEFLRDKAQQFFMRVRGKDDLVGVHRVTRILRLGAGEVWGLDKSVKSPDIEQTVLWLDRAILNIEDAIEQIERRQMLWLTVFAAAFAGVAALLSFLGLIVDLVRSLAHCS